MTPRKKSKGPSPTERSLKELRKRGYLVDIVERRIPFKFITHDYLHLFDAIAIHPDAPGCLGLQFTTNSNVSSHIKKMMANPALAVWVRAGNEACIMSWSKKGARGKPKRWTVTERYLLP